MWSGRRWGWRPALFYGLAERASGATAYHPHLHAMAAREAAEETYKGLPPELTRLRSLLSGGLSATAALWVPVEAAYDWVSRAAAILANVAGLTGAAVKASYRGLLGAMARHTAGAGDLAGALGQFRKVTRSYW